MNIFISWSGDPSREIAQELKDWIPLVIQSAKPYYTPSDIEPGQRWNEEITKKLSDSLIGLICLTKDNTEKPWILFEAGALSNSLDKSRVCPILFGVKKAEITGPLSGIQLTVFDESNFYHLIQTINRLSEASIDDSILKSSYDAFFPRLESKVKEILQKYESSSTITSLKPERSDRNILEEILDLVRKQNNTSIESEFVHATNTKRAFTNSSIQNKFSIGDKIISPIGSRGEVVGRNSLHDDQIFMDIQFESDPTKWCRYYSDSFDAFSKL